MVSFSKLYNDMRESLELDGDRTRADPVVQCPLCSSKERLLNFSKLQKGDHIVIPGEKGSVNYADKLIYWYTHHSIVKSVQVVSRGTVLATLIHFFHTPFDAKIKIQETTEYLDLYHHEIYVVRYRQKPHAPDDIIRRAETIMAENTKTPYSLFKCNCEHFCHWCCVGSEQSLQTHNLKDMLNDLLSGSLGSVGKVLRAVCKLLSYTPDDLSQIAYSSLRNVPWCVVSVMAILYLLYTIYRHTILSGELKTGKICSSCCRRSKRELWARFFSYCAVQAGGLGLLQLVTAAVASKGIVIGVVAICAVLCLAVTSAVPRVLRLFSSPFEGRLVTVTNLEEVDVGDVISFDHWKLSHDGIVTSCRFVNQKTGTFTVIHYSLPKLFGTRQIVEETIQVHLEKDLIRLHDYSGYDIYDTGEVIQRARQRLGEAKFSLLSNRSCHFCHWAKVREPEDDINLGKSTDETELRFVRSIRTSDDLVRMRHIHIDHRRNKKHASKRLGCVSIRIRDEVKEGQIVEFKNNGVMHKAISTNVKFEETCVSKITLSVVHYSNKGVVCEENFDFDLRYDQLWIHKVHPINRFGKEEVIRRARAKVGLRRHTWVVDTSSRLAEEISVKDRDRIAIALADIKPGDVIKFYYWSLLHDAVVTAVESRETKSGTSGRVTVVHYALKHLFDTRSVVEESFEMDLERERVYVKNYGGFVTYPPEIVVKRAKSRLGEQRFNAFGNTSSDLVYWAKVVQTPAIVQGSTIESMDLLLPRVQTPRYGNFQVVKACAWSDLKVGMIVEFTYYFIKHQGILSSVDETGKQIKVIHYGASHLFATRTIMEDSVSLDFRKNTITIYRVDPTKSNPTDVILRNAKKRLGEQEWGKANRSWDFCLSCVMKQEPKMV